LTPSSPTRSRSSIVWLELNRQYSETWPNITTKKPAPPDADAFVSEPDKFAKYFTPAPGAGD
jgi:ferredoxin